MPNCFGHSFRITSFGESHGRALGVVIDGCPAGLRLSVAKIDAALARRRPGTSSLVSKRREEDRIEVLSGIDREGTSIGSPICLIVRNNDARPEDYDAFRDVYRPGHGDYTYHRKYGVLPQSGGGRLSARETLARVAAGSVAAQLVQSLSPRTSVTAFVSAIGPVECQNFAPGSVAWEMIEQSPLRCPDPDASEKMLAIVKEARDRGDSVGGCIRCWITSPQVGLGEPVFDKFEADLAKGMLSIPASRGFELGQGFGASQMWGSDHNDSFANIAGELRAPKNSAGGLLGGISTGEPINFRVGFKPTSTIASKQQTVSVSGEECVRSFGGGRHDPCVVPRAVPIVEAMAWLVLADHLLRARGDRCDP